MTREELQRITDLPDHILPTKDQMIEYYLEFQNDTGATSTTTFTTGIDDIIQNYQMAKEYFREKIKRTASTNSTFLNLEKINLDRFKD